MRDLRLEDLSASNIADANNLSLKPGQEAFIAPVSYALAAVIIDPSMAWQRVVLDAGKVVGFIHGNFDPDSPHEEFRACVWRINVDAEAQGKGVGRFAVKALVEEARRRNFSRVTVIWEPGEAGPGDFFHHIGFKDIGVTQYGETIGALEIDDPSLTDSEE